MYSMFAQTVKHIPGQVCHIYISAMSNDDGRMSIILVLPDANVDAEERFCFIMSISEEQPFACPIFYIVKFLLYLAFFFSLSQS